MSNSMFYDYIAATTTEPLSTEEIMQIMVRTGFAHDYVLEKCFDFALQRFGLRVALAQIEAAAHICGIHSDEVMRSNLR
jgi:hypothetical protein